LFVCLLIEGSTRALRQGDQQTQLSRICRGVLTLQEHVEVACDLSVEPLALSLQHLTCGIQQNFGEIIPIRRQRAWPLDLFPYTVLDRTDDARRADDRQLAGD